MKSLSFITSKKNKKAEFTLSQCLFYSLPHTAIILLYTPIAILQGIYAKYYGVSLVAIAGVILFARLFDAVSDPLIGFLSDRYHARTGTRKPFMVVGGLLFIVAGYFLYVPAADVTIVYFACWFIIFYLGWTLFEIPHLAWGGELANDTDDKTKIYSVRAATGYLGLLLFYTIPLLPFFNSTEITPETLRWCAIATAVLMLPTLYLSMKRVPDGHGHVSIGRFVKQHPADRKLLLRSFIHNKPLLIFLGVFIFSGLGIGVWYGLIFIYVDAYLGLGDQFAKMFLYAFIFGLLTTPLWYKLGAWTGKKPAWCLVVLVLFASCIYTGFLQRGEVGFSELLVLKMINTFGFVGMNILMPSIMSDIVDYGTWKFRADQGASYFALQTFLYKFFYASGAALGLAIAGWYGFDPASAAQTSEGIFGMRLAIVWVPAILFLISLGFSLFIPINARRHTIIRQRLNTCRQPA